MAGLRLQPSSLKQQLYCRCVRGSQARDHREEDDNFDFLHVGSISLLPKMMTIDIFFLLFCFIACLRFIALIALLRGQQGNRWQQRCALLLTNYKCRRNFFHNAAGCEATMAYWYNILLCLSSVYHGGISLCLASEGETCTAHTHTQCR